MTQRQWFFSATIGRKRLLDNGISDAWLLLFVLSVPLAAQNIELRLQPDAIEHGVPQAFTFSLLNTSDHDVRVPGPAIQCDDSYGGAIWLRLKFTPDAPAKPGMARGCAGDTFGHTPILDRIQKWSLLRPGQYLIFNIPRERLYYDDQDPGIYEFWAEYVPPSIELADREILQKAGIDFPQAKLTSPHIAFRKTP